MKFSQCSRVVLSSLGKGEQKRIATWNWKDPMPALPACPSMGWSLKSRKERPSLKTPAIGKERQRGRNDHHYDLVNSFLLSKEGTTTINDPTKIFKNLAFPRFTSTFNLKSPLIDTTHLHHAEPRTMRSIIQGGLEQPENELPNCSKVPQIITSIIEECLR